MSVLKPWMVGSPIPETPHTDSGVPASWFSITIELDRRLRSSKASNVGRKNRRPVDRGGVRLRWRHGNLNMLAPISPAKCGNKKNQASRPVNSAYLSKRYTAEVGCTSSSYLPE